MHLRLFTQGKKIILITLADELYVNGLRHSGCLGDASGMYGGTAGSR